MSNLYDIINAYAATNGVDPDIYLSKLYAVQKQYDGTIRSFDPSLYELPSSEQGTTIAALQERLFRLLNDELYKSAGFGGFYNQLQTVVSEINRYGPTPLAPNRVSSGYTFITRPQLNLSTSNILNNRVLSILDTDDSRDINFMIRGLLDPRWYMTWMEKTNQISKLLNPHNALFTPLCNTLLSCTGWPDFVLEADKGDAGFFNEGLSIASGSDRMKRGADLSLTFKEIHGGIIMTIFHMWVEYMAAVVKNEVVAYPQEIDQRRLNYTVSIYRFIMTPDKQYIQHCAKATGCFPLNVPLGNVFNVNQGELHVAAAKEFTINFTANIVEYDDPIIPYEFNLLMKRYWPNIDSAFRNESTLTTDQKQAVRNAANEFKIRETPSFDPKFGLEDPAGQIVPGLNAFSSYLRYNYTGIPYIKSVPNKGLKLVFMYEPKTTSDGVNMSSATEEQLQAYSKYGPIEDAVDEIVLAKNERYARIIEQNYQTSNELQTLMNNVDASAFRI
jgi:hypothetical protein